MRPPRLYLRPLGLLAGDAARDAVQQGWALPFGSDDAAFAGGEICRRDTRGIARTSLAAADLRRWASEQSHAVREWLETALWRLAEPVRLPAGLPQELPSIMGVLNVTPDSFSDGGRFLAAGAAIEQGRKMAAAGAAIIDVGGESTRPGSRGVSAEEQIGRVLPVVRALAQDGICVSIDTRKAVVMAAALDAGARLVNDISALEHDPNSLPLLASRQTPVVLMHCQGDPATMQERPTYERAPLDVYDYLEDRIAACEAAGMTREHLLADPGIGFGKTVAHNVDILHHLALYRGLGVPLMLGVSRKSFIARLAGEAAADQRLGGSIAAALCGVAAGASVLRVHDVAETRQAVRVHVLVETSTSMARNLSPKRSSDMAGPVRQSAP